MCHITVINGKSDCKFKELRASKEIMEAGKYNIVCEQRLVKKLVAKEEPQSIKTHIME